MIAFHYNSLHPNTLDSRRLCMEMDLLWSYPNGDFSFVLLIIYSLFEGGSVLQWDNHFAMVFLIEFVQPM